MGDGRILALEEVKDGKEVKEVKERTANLFRIAPTLLLDLRTF